jgi:hypothetical protein
MPLADTVCNTPGHRSQEGSGWVRTASLATG